MSYHLLHNDGHMLLASDTPVIKARDRQPLADAIALLDRLRAESTRRDAETAAMHADARARGHAEGLAAGQAAFCAAIAELAEQAAAHQRHEEAEIATLALAALRQIAGEIGDAAMIEGVALRAARAVVAQGDVVIDVSPALAPAIGQRIAASEPPMSITVRADPTLGDHECRVTAPGSRIIADLDRQFEELAERWGVQHVD